MARKSKRTVTDDKDTAQPEGDVVVDAVIVDADTPPVNLDEGDSTSPSKDEALEQATETSADVPGDGATGSEAPADMAAPDAEGEGFVIYPSDTPDEEVPPAEDAPTDEDTANPGDASQPLDGEVVAEGDVGPQDAPSDTPDFEQSEPEADSAPVPATLVPAEEKRGSGFFPLVLGGLVAGAIGYAIPTFLMAPPAPPEIDMSRVEALEAQLADLQPAGAPAVEVDLSGLETAQADFSGQLDGFDARIAALEAAPAPVVAAPVQPETAPEVTSALQTLRSDVAALADQIAALPLPVEGLADRVASVEEGLSSVEQSLNDLSAEAASVETTAEDLARQAASNQLRLAVAAGQPFAEQLAVLGGDVPPALASAAETGVATTQSLASDFPEAARAALAEARRVEPVDGNPLTAFLRRQTAARSLEPREGTDADAVLSRAEAALRSGDISTALSETATLPPEAAAVLSDWIERAQARVAAQEALQDYLKTE